MTKHLRQPYDGIFAAFRCGFRSAYQDFALQISGVRRPKPIDAAATAAVCCSLRGPRGCRQDGDRGDSGRDRCRGGRRALFLAGVDGDGLADVARGLEGQ
jgi:hypothetical protein